MRKNQLLFILFVLLAFGPTAWAQTPLGDIPAEVRAEDATITQFGHATMTVEMKIVTDSLTRRTDTLLDVVNIEWDTPSGTAKQRNAQLNKGNNPNGSGFYNQGGNSWLDIYWYRYNYPSIDAEGKPVLLSSLACMPDEDCDYINNVIIGCHVTITSNKECPSQYNSWDNWNSDVSMLMNHAGSGLIFHSSQNNYAYYNLVILPDYEGYGLTRNHAHPYLYQELTARQVVDGVRYGIALYKNSPTVSAIRHPFRNGWRSISVGYSQGGSVALATQRFIEQNGLSDELQFAGSVCGDGPYDPVATLMYYVWQYAEHHSPLSMPVVMPLILKGMCDSNPYMKNHQVSDYLSSDFLATNILQWLTDKEKTTEDITQEWLWYYMGIPDHVTPDGEVLTLGLDYVLGTGGYNFFRNLYNAYSSTYTSAAGVPLPTKRGLFEDLHYALESNNLTKGWVPQHTVCLYHSYDDSVVPEVNRQSALNSLGDWVVQLHASGVWQYDHVGSGRQFYLGTAEFDAIRAVAKLPVIQTTQHAINVKNNLPPADVDPSPSITPANNVVRDFVSLNGQQIEAEYTIAGSSAFLGSGYNACISQYSEGKVEVPATITVGGITYPVNEVSNVAFRMCNKVTEVVLPENVYHIGNFAFQGCQALTKVTLPSTLTSIGSGAFIDLPHLTIIDLKATTPPQWLYNDVFKFHAGGIGDQAVYTYEMQLLVPESTVQTYKDASYSDPTNGWTKSEGWGNITNIDVGASVNAQAYATFKDGVLTFYYDTHRIDRQNNGLTTYGIAPSDYVMGFPGWLAPGNDSHANEITTVEFTPLFQYARPTTTDRWFNECVHLNTIIGMDHLRTDEVTDMSYMFKGCTSLEDDDLDFSQFNTTSVTNMKYMFEGCTGITQLDLSGFDTHNCTNMQNMFDGCTGLISIDLSSFETTECNFNYMFHNCSNLEEISIGSFGSADTYICVEMFENCNNLTTLVIPSAFNKYNQAFKGCTKMREVYCYKPEPFEVWQLCATDFDTHTSYSTQFHVLAETYDAWVAAYGPGSETPANVTFVGDLGTEENPYLLYSTTDWMNIRELVNRDFSVNAKMMNDFSVTTMMGTIAHPFKGTFDGNGHTLTVNYTITSETPSIEDAVPAPFSTIRNATIKNLHVDGTITVSSLRSAIGGLVGICAKPEGNETVTNTITNCHVSTQVYGKTTNLGGIAVAVYENVSTTISGCLFDGKLSVDHNFSTSYNEGIYASAIVFSVHAESNTNVVDCVERGTYENTNIRNFCDLGNAANNYCFNSGFDTNAKRAYSLTTDTEGLVLDFGTPQVTYDVSGITAFSTGMKIDDVFYAGTDQLILVTITAPGYENVGTPSINGGAELSAIDQIHYNVYLAPADAVISMPGMAFTTILLYDDATDNSLTLEKYIDQTHKVQLVGHTLHKNWQWNPLCLPFDLSGSELDNSPLAGARLKVLDAITFDNKVAVYHFKDTTAITANKPYLVSVSSNDIVDPIFNNVRIKRSLPPGMKVDAGGNTQTGFAVKGNYNRTSIDDISGTDHFYTAFYFDGTTLRPVKTTTRLNAFRCFFEVCVDPATIVAAVLDIEGGANCLAILDDRYSDVDDIFYLNGNWDEYGNWAKETIPNANTKVLIEGEAIIPNGCVAQAGEIVIDEGDILIRDGGQLFHSNEGVVATVEKAIAGHNGDNNSGWYFIASPLTADLTPLEANGFLTNTYDLYYYDEPACYWRNYKLSANSLDPGFDIEPLKGYLYANSEGTTLSMTGTLLPCNQPVTIDGLSHSATELTGFNLVGNPFACNATIDRSFYIINGKNVVANTGSTIIAPGTGVMVQADAEHESVTFTSVLPSAQASQSNGNLQINLTQAGTRGNESIDNAIVSFEEGKRLEKYVFNADLARLYIPQNNKDYAVAIAEKQDVIPLNFKATENGNFSISVKPEELEMAYLHLIDNLTGADIDLLQTSSYSFEAKTDDYASRFKLVFSAQNIDVEADDDFAYVSNGNIIVNGTGTLQIIDMTGRILLNRQASSVFCLPSSVFSPGVYILRLTNGDDIKTQKILIGRIF